MLIHLLEKWACVPVLPRILVTIHVSPADPFSPSPWAKYHPILHTPYPDTVLVSQSAMQRQPYIEKVGCIHEGNGQVVI